MTVRVEHSDCLAVIPQLVAEGIAVDAVICDPPYHLLQTVKRFQSTTIGGSSDIERRAKSREDGLGRLAGGFMGQEWDGGDIAFRPETWAIIATVLRPGGFLLAFGGTRTHHRMVCAIEDAGFVIQDTIMWLYGSGFPKRRDMLKPAFEPVCVAYKPGGKRTLQVDECRIPSEPIHTTQTPSRNAGTIYGSDQRTRVEFKNIEGRWPANICHDGSAEVMEAFAAFGEKSSGDATVINSNGYDGLAGGSAFARSPTSKSYGGPNTGSAARFFYCSKADGEDRWGSRHPTVKPVELIRYLVKLVCPIGGTFLDPFAGTGTAGVAALATGRNAILIEQDAGYIADIHERMAHYEGDGRHSLAARNRNARETRGTLL